MILADKHYSLIEKFLNNKLSDNQLEEFEKYMKQPSFRDVLLFQAKQMDVHLQVEHEHLKEQIRGKVSSPNLIREKFPMYMLGRVAASIILLIGITGWFVYSQALWYDADEVAEEYFYSLPVPTHLRGSAEMLANERIQETVRLYIIQKYPEVIAIVNDNPRLMDGGIQLMEAVSFYNENQPKRAQEILFTILDDPIQEVRENAHWYALVTAYHNKEPRKAKKVMQRMLDDPNHKFHKRAIRFKKDLRNPF